MQRPRKIRKVSPDKNSEYCGISSLQVASKFVVPAPIRASILFYLRNCAIAIHRFPTIPEDLGIRLAGPEKE